MKTVLIIFFVIFTAIFSSVDFFSPDTSSSFVRWADPHYPKITSLFSYSFKEPFDEKLFWNLNFGALVPTVRILNSKNREIVTFRIYADIKARFEFGSSSFTTYCSDFTGGILTTLPFGTIGPGETIIALAHTSSHMGDEYLMISNNINSRINYSREEIETGYTIKLTPILYQSIILGTILRKDPTDIKGRLFLQSHTHLQLKKIAMLNLNIKIRQEMNWAADINMQAAIYLGSQEKRLKQSFIFEYFYGFSSLGQFYKTKESQISMGFAACL